MFFGRVNSFELALFYFLYDKFCRYPEIILHQNKMNFNINKRGFNNK